MTETPDRRRVSEIARSLNQYEWRPTAGEVACGAEFFQLVKGMEEAERSDFPRDASARPWPLRLRTENVVVLAEEVALLREEFLPGWRTRLPDGSPMAELIDLYVRGAQPVLRQAEAVRAAWEGAVLPEPAGDEIARHVRYSGAPTDEVTARLRFETAARWEEGPDQRSLWEAMEPAWNYLGGVRSTMMAAVSGDVEY
ncbi:hypothetical protein ACM01_14090 [Streptomyces viridochromogenes]|uniref:Uncharacterized protein n=1 Tax=Streptomyces viridochromogenes TaxID=1938 RepID=A0A0J7ZG86_STRVR|nr:hypothetical protein [Streptomyces viridochromogenes]KMS74417.1 hypothetical protein ACM01_14090 [Streptomyces viridochromogenes]